MFWVYVLRSEKTGRHYTGSCQDVAERLRRHNAGHSPATRTGVPWLLIHAEPHPTKAAACARERHLKTGHGRAELDGLLTTLRSR
ncbi:MAG: GIY-YIG nuclease family protein [Phycisphaerales bacterium]